MRAIGDLGQGWFEKLELSGQVAPFEAGRFQFWFRDPPGGPAGFNFSDGLSVTFCP